MSALKFDSASMPAVKTTFWNRRGGVPKYAILSGRSCQTFKLLFPPVPSIIVSFSYEVIYLVVSNHTHQHFHLLTPSPITLGVPSHPSKKPQSWHLRKSSQTASIKCFSIENISPWVDPQRAQNTCLGPQCRAGPGKNLVWQVGARSRVLVRTNLLF